LSRVPRRSPAWPRRNKLYSAAVAKPGMPDLGGMMGRTPVRAVGVLAAWLAGVVVVRLGWAGLG